MIQAVIAVSGVLVGIAALATVIYARRDKSLVRSRRAQWQADRDDKNRDELVAKLEELEERRDERFVESLQAQLRQAVERLERIDKEHGDDRARWREELQMVQDRLSVCEEERADLRQDVFEVQGRQRQMIVAFAEKLENERPGAGAEFMAQTRLPTRPGGGIERRGGGDRRSELP